MHFHGRGQSERKQQLRKQLFRINCKENVKYITLEETVFLACQGSSALKVLLFSLDRGGSNLVPEVKLK